MVFSICSMPNEGSRSIITLMSLHVKWKGFDAPFELDVLVVYASVRP